jgi:hypothetical protein
MNENYKELKNLIYFGNKTFFRIFEEVINVKNQGDYRKKR